MGGKAAGQKRKKEKIELTSKFLSWPQDGGLILGDQEGLEVGDQERCMWDRSSRWLCVIHTEMSFREELNIEFWNSAESSGLEKEI